MPLVNYSPGSIGLLSSLADAYRRAPQCSELGERPYLAPVLVLAEDHVGGLL